jgi:FixJ family two-component response regulator
VLEVHRRNPKMAIVIASGYAEIPKDASSPLPSGVVFLRKPYDDEQLHQALGKARSLIAKE